MELQLKFYKFQIIPNACSNSYGNQSYHKYQMCTVKWFKEINSIYLSKDCLLTTFSYSFLHIFKFRLYNYSEMKNIKNQNRLFSVCYKTQQNILPGQFTRNLLLANMAFYITHLLTLKCTSISSFKIQINFTLFIVLLCYIMTLGLQALVLMLLGKEFYLAAQIRIFRFVLMDHGLGYILGEVINPSKLDHASSKILFTVYFLMTFLIVAFINFEDYHEKTLVVVNFSYSFSFFLFGLLLALIDNVQNHSIRTFLLFCLMLCIYNAIVNEGRISTNNWQKRFIAIMVKITLLISIYVLISHILSKDMDTYLFYFILLCVYIGVGIALNQRQKMLKNKDFQSTQNTQDFLIRIQSISFDIDQVLNGDKKFQDTELKAYLSGHELNCQLTNCPLFGQQSKNQLKNLQQTKYIKSTLKKLKKHLQLHFESRVMMNGEDYSLSFGYLAFLVAYASQKRKSLQLYNTLIKESYDPRKSYNLYRIKMKIDKLEDEESIVSKNASGILFQTYNQLSLNIIEIFRKICSILLQQKIDFNLFTSVTHQLNRQRIQLDQFIQKIYNLQTFGVYRILTQYCQYSKQLFHEQQKAKVIERHLQNLIEKLDHKKQIQFLSNRSQVGLVAISLSQNSLGNVFSINKYAQSVFGLQGKDIIGKSVNNIMPSTFAQYHDSLLMVFLKNRNKKVNGDERVLVGKHKNGLIFPVLLRLQRVIASSDQLVFVANIRRYKTRQSPIMFIATPQGEVVDYSAGFQYYFMKNTRQKAFNVYEVSSNFGDLSVQSAENLKIFNISCQFKPNTIVSVDFNVVPLVFFGNLSAFYLFGKRTIQTSKSNLPVIPITNVFNDLIFKQQLYCHYNNFVTQNNQDMYIMYNKTNQIDPRQCRNRELTIPFIHMDSFSSLINMQLDGDKNYSKGIRTIRLVKKHFQPVQAQSDQILSEFSPQQDNFFVSKKKIINFDQINKSFDNLIITQKLIFFITIVMIVLNLGSFQAIDLVNVSKNQSLSTQVSQFQIKEYVSDFILFSNYRNMSYNQDFFVRQFPLVQNRVVNALQIGKITQQSKQCYYRIIYSQHTWSSIGSLFSKPLIISNISQAQQFIWSMNISLTVLLILLFIIYICIFKEKIFSIYSYFLCLDENMITTALSNCQKLNNLAIGMDISCNQAQQNDKNLDSGADNDTSFIKKYKSFNTSSRKHDILNIIQIFVTIILIAALISIMIVKSKSIEKRIDAVINLSAKFSQIKAQTSVEILSSFLYKSNPNISLFSKFDEYLQRLQIHTVNYLEFQNNETLTAIIDTFILGNICESPYFLRNDENCAKTASNISSNGIFSVLDFIHSQTLQINNNQTKDRALQKLSILVVLQYQIVEKSIKKLRNIINQTKIYHQESLQSLYYLICTIIIIMLIIQQFFLKAVPFKNMKNQMKLVFNIIQLFQSIKKSKQSKPKYK